MFFGTLAYFSWIQVIAPKSIDLQQVLYFIFHLTCMSEIAGTFQKAMSFLCVGNWAETLFDWCLCDISWGMWVRYRAVKAVFAKLSTSYCSVLNATPFTATSINLGMCRIDWYSVVLLQGVWENLSLWIQREVEDRRSVGIKCNINWK